MKFDYNYLFIGLLASLFFIPFIGNAHLFDWDEINFAECSREMILTGEYLRPQINFAPFWEKPPLFIWFQCLSMHVFGVNEFAARFPNALCGVLTFLLIYHLGKKLYDKIFGGLWVVGYLGSFLPHLYFKSGIIDPWFNLLIFFSLIFLFPETRATTSNTSVSHIRNYTFAGIFCGLAILTKGPVAYLIISLVFLAKSLIFNEINLKKIKNYFFFSVTALVVALIWFGIETLKNGTWFIKTFIEYNIRLAQTEDSGHGGFVGYHFVVLLFGCFPASIFAINALFTRYNFEGEKVDFTRLMKVLFWVVLILFSLVQSKIVHYSSLCYLPLTFLSTITLKKYIENGKITRFSKISLLSIGILLGLIIGILPILGQNIDIIKPLFQKDIFALKNLDAAISWSNAQILVGLVYIFALIIFPFALKKRGILRGSLFLFLASALFLNAALIVFINKIEGYSQNAAITFYKEHADEDCYITTFHFKSYAHLFYAKKESLKTYNILIINGL
ncbi:MAG: glycosyltransferase family 39 protein [Saprospiraceae bacterium]|nr:glycosyltransferase family 39 protein [Saprospiraceae bacterium]